MINLLTNKKKSFFFFIKSVKAIQILKCELTTFELTTHLNWACAFCESGSKISQRTYFVFSNNLRCIDCKKPQP